VHSLQSQSRPVRALALIAVIVASEPPALAAQTTTDAAVRAAIEAYDAGEFDRAVSLLDRLPASLPAPDQAVRWIYRGLIHFARGAADSAATAFQRAVRVDPTVRLDPGLHSPNRVDVFETARLAVVREWRTQARSADARADTVEAMRRWASVLSAMPADAEATERLAGLRSSPREAPADPPRTPVAMPEPVEPEPAAPPRVLDPGRAALLGLLVPGLGEIYTGKTGRGALIMASSAIAVGAGLLIEKVTVDCLSPPVAGVCPVENIAGERRERPYLAPGVGFAVVATLIGAVDAALTADRASRQAAASAAPGDGASLHGPRLRSDGVRLSIDLIRVAF